MKDPNIVYPLDRNRAGRYLFLDDQEALVPDSLWPLVLARSRSRLQSFSDVKMNRDVEVMHWLVLCLCERGVLLRRSSGL